MTNRTLTNRRAKSTRRAARMIRIWIWPLELPE
jgi:hypothetical protein